MALRLALVLLGSALAVSAQAQSSVYTDVGQAIEAEADTTIQAHGALRTRAEALYNLDLDRGLTPSGQALFPVPLADPTGQWLTHADMRLRTDVSVHHQTFNFLSLLLSLTSRQQSHAQR